MSLGQNGTFYAYGYHKTLIGNLQLEAELTGYRDPMTTGSGRNAGLGLERFTSLISPQRRQIEQRLLLTRTGHRRLTIICHNHRYRLITGKDGTPLVIFSAHLSTVNCHRRARHIMSCRRWVTYCTRPVCERAWMILTFANICTVLHVHVIYNYNAA